VAGGLVDRPVPPTRLERVVATKAFQLLKHPHVWSRMFVHGAVGGAYGTGLAGPIGGVAGTLIGMAVGGAWGVGLVRDPYVALSSRAKKSSEGWLLEAVTAGTFGVALEFNGTHAVAAVLVALGVVGDCWGTVGHRLFFERR